MIIEKEHEKCCYLFRHFDPDNANLVWWDAGNGWLTYADLLQQIENASVSYPSSKALIYIPFKNILSHVVHYLAALQSGHAVMLADPAISQEQREQVFEVYGVNAWVDENGGLIWRNPDVNNIHPSLALLLPTSGSTGTSKWVRISYSNLESNAKSIIDYLDIKPSDKAITSLPSFYSYGLSVINTHFAAGAAVVNCEHSILDRQFWQVVEQLNVTSFSGVPFTYQMLKKMRFNWAKYPSLKTLTQAGGKLEPELTTYFAQEAIKLGHRFFVMYGQTEASPRMSWLADSEVVECPDSIGRAVKDGEFLLREVEGLPTGQGELIYRGPNVMMGYAESAQDLLKGFEYSELETGDIASVDELGRYYICGRLKRFIKLFGKRVNLADVEVFLQQQDIESACVQRDDVLWIAVESDAIDFDEIKKKLALWLKVPIGVVKFIVVSELPRTANLKIDYKSLAALEPQL